MVHLYSKLQNFNRRFGIGQNLKQTCDKFNRRKQVFKILIRPNYFHEAIKIMFYFATLLQYLLVQKKM